MSSASGIYSTTPHATMGRTSADHISHQRIAEKLIVLNDRSLGMLTRLYNIKKACADPKSKPAFLTDKSLDGAIKNIVKKFPVVDTKSNSTMFQYVNSMKTDITRNLSLYYYTFADLLDLRDHILQLLTTMDVAQCQLDITVNYDVTTAYLNLVVNLICLMILLSKVDDRRAVLGLFNAAYDLTHAQSEPSFPRLGQMIIDYENPLRKLAEDLGPLNRLIIAALKSVSALYVRRNISAEQWRKAELLSFTANPKQLLYTAVTEEIAGEYLSLDVMDRWIILCVTVCSSNALNDPILYNMYQRAMQSGLVIRLFRDEVFPIHSQLQAFFESIKGFAKKTHDIKDCYAVAVDTSIAIHRERRRFLRGALKDLCLLLKDQPGLLGPKALFVWMGLSYSRDEVLWYLRHVDAFPEPAKKNKRETEDINDKLLPELLFYMNELRSLVTKYAPVISRYYVRYIRGYEAVELRQIIQSLQNLREEDMIVMSSFVTAATELDRDSTDFSALRLDWFRLQATLSSQRSSFRLLDNKRFASVMNSTVFHLKMIDLQQEMLRETSDLSIFCFYTKQLENQLRQCLTLPSQSRFSISYAFICSHFVFALHDMCPEEKIHIVERGLSLCNMILEQLARETTNVISRLGEHEMMLFEKLSTRECAGIIAEVMPQKTGKHAANTVRRMPGEESVRIIRDQLTLPDKLTTALVELCSAVGYCRELTVSEHIFAPREFLCQEMERYLGEVLRESVIKDTQSGEHPRRPSEMLAILNAHISVLQMVDSCVSIDMMKLLTTALLQQTQPLDSQGSETLTSIYCKWYLEVLLRRASNCQIVYSDHFESFISNSENLPFAPEQYTDTQELNCLAQLIGPYGVKYLSERLIWHVASQITELNKIVRDNRDLLMAARTSFDKPERMRELVAQLSGADQRERRNTSNHHQNTPVGGAMESVLQRVTIIGEIIAFRDLLHNALHDVLEHRTPFLLASLHELNESIDERDRLAISEMCAAVGNKTTVDLALVNAIRTQAQNQRLTNPEEHYSISCLLFVFIAVSLPKLALASTSFFRAHILASQNNSHTIPLAVNTLAGALFTLHEKNDIVPRMKEFLALASSGLLQILGTPDAEAMKEHQSVFIILEQLVKRSPYLTFDLLESCFPYNLIRTSYLSCYNRHD
uniref:Nck-associated protein 1 n=1 Tax=Steinernema glaseri TaxID=37863 RepID=A0A1I8ADZ0_9BILA